MLLRPGGVCVQRVWARQMSTFGNNLIERLRTRLIDVRPEDQLGQGSIALAADVAGLVSSDFAFVISPTEMATLKTAADAARLFNFHPATVSRLLANAGAEAIRVKRLHQNT